MPKIRRFIASPADMATKSAKSPKEVEKIKKERIEVERLSQEKEHLRGLVEMETKKIALEEERQKRLDKKMNVAKLILSWKPEIWRDKTGSVVRTSAELWGSYDEINNKWNNKPMDLMFREEGHEYWINVDYLNKDLLLNPPEKELAFSTKINITGENRTIKLFFYDKDWYHFQAEISFDDAVVLIAADKLRKKQKTEHKEQKLQREIDRANNLLKGKDTKRHRKSIPKSVQSFVWNRDGGRCVECGSKEKLEFDHIIPFSKGGSDTARNLQLLCEKCNRKKSNKIG